MLDLFGEIVVTVDDIREWVAAVAPSFCSNDRSFAHYVQQWDVAAKVARAKRDGTFDTTIENARTRRASLARRFGF